MPFETAVLKTAKDTAEKTIHAVDSAMKKFWSILDAAVEKKSPGEYMSPKGINSMRGQDS